MNTTAITALATAAIQAADNAETRDAIRRQLAHVQQCAADAAEISGAVWQRRAATEADTLIAMARRALDGVAARRGAVAEGAAPGAVSRLQAHLDGLIAAAERE